MLKDCELAQELLKKNAVHVDSYSKTLVTRGLYTKNHPTVIVVLKCMDGRIHYSVMVKLAPGIVIPFRNMGGIFDLGWLYFGQVIEEIVMQAIGAGLPVLFIITYHYSHGLKERGCRAFEYEVEDARNYAFDLKAQFDRVFDPANSEAVYTAVVRIETDRDGFLIHGENDHHLDLYTLNEATPSGWIEEELHKLFPSAGNQIRDDFLPHIIGNIGHQIDVVKENRSDLDCHHRERVIAVGRWFDWLHELNLALIIGPLSCDTADPIRGAAEVVWENYSEDNDLFADGLVVMASAPYTTKEYPYYSRAKEKATYLANLALQNILAVHPELEDQICVMPGLISTSTREFTRIPFERRLVR